MLLPLSIVHSFLRLSSLPLRGHSPSYLSADLLMDAWAALYVPITNKAAMNLCGQVFVWTYPFISLGFIPRSGMAGLILTWRRCSTVFYSEDFSTFYGFLPLHTLLGVLPWEAAHSPWRYSYYQNASLNPYYQNASLHPRWAPSPDNKSCGNRVATWIKRLGRKGGGYGISLREKCAWHLPLTLFSSNLLSGDGSWQDRGHSGQLLPSTLLTLLCLELLHFCLHSCHVSLPEALPFIPSPPCCQSDLLTVRIWPVLSQIKTFPWLPYTGGSSPNSVWL